MPYNKHNYRVTVPHRSGFDKSHRNSGTLTCGTLTPLLCDEVIPNSRVSLKLNLATQLPPLVSDTYMNLKLKTEAFFVPMRLCCGSFEDFFCDVPKDILFPSDSMGEYNLDQEKLVVPSVIIDKDSFSNVTAFRAAVEKWFGPGSLMDYLGFTYNVPDDTSDIQPVHINIMPAIAYALVYQEWYRNPRVQRPLFGPIGKTESAGTVNEEIVPVANFPFHKYTAGEQYDFYTLLLRSENTGILSGSGYLIDGSCIFDLRQRNFPLDYFTGARVDAQQGDSASVRIDLPTGADATSFTIAQLRAANSLQQFRERNNIASPRMVDQVKARYGAVLSDSVAQRPICIGSATYDVASTGVSQTGGASEGANPFSGIAAQYGRAYGSGSDFIISDFTANEPGYILVLVSLVPEVTYSSLADKKFLRYTSLGSITEMATPLLQNVGDQPIRGYELTGVLGNIGSDHIFGYQDRFADFMFIPNQCHAQMKEGQYLAPFVLQRWIEGPSGEPGRAELSTSFLEIPKDYLDGVLAASEAVSGVSAWYDSYLDYKVSMPLAEFSIPSLQDPAYEHGRSISLRRNGQIF